MRRSTIIYLALFAVVLAAAYFFNEQAKTTKAEATPEATSAPIEYLFTSTEGLPTRIKVESKAGDIVEVALNEENVWTMVQPEETAADQGSVEAAAGQVSTIRILDRIPDLAPEAVGLNDPEYTLTFQFTNGVERIIEIGVSTPTQSGYYTPGENGEILIISRGPVDALTGLLANLPYAPTEIPVPTATP
jgi:hypothetical protein